MANNSYTTEEKARAQRVYKSQQRGLEKHQDTQEEPHRQPGRGGIKSRVQWKHVAAVLYQHEKTQGKNTADTSRTGNGKKDMKMDRAHAQEAFGQYHKTRIVLEPAGGNKKRQSEKHQAPRPPGRH